MKLVTYRSHPGADAHVGVLWHSQGSDWIVDASPARMIDVLHAGDAGMAAVRKSVDHAQGLAAIRGLDPAHKAGLLHPLAQCELLAPIPRPGKIVSVGANYQAHIQEGRNTGALGALPAYPPAFLKMPSAVVGPDATVPYPAGTEELDYEVELCLVIGRACQDVPADRWQDVVAGYTICNDLGMRDVILREKDSGIVTEGKNFPGSCPLGPWLVTRDEIADPANLGIGLRVNGQVRQADRTSSMIHSLGEIVAYWSRLGLEPGDVITTGTPGGVAGFGKRHPERLLKPGDVIDAEIEGLGLLRTTIGPARTSHTPLPDAA